MILFVLCLAVVVCIAALGIWLLAEFVRFLIGDAITTTAA